MSGHPAKGRGQLRIIGGQWRGRKLAFPAVEGLRPTADRVRETLFNWLQFDLPGARCLDLFAGSGALGLEALSRGAAEVLFVERAAPAARAIEAHLNTLGATDRARVRRADARALLDGPATPFDILFLDPPFASDLLAPCARRLERNGWLAPEALIYIETPARTEPPPLPGNWNIERHKRAGEVTYRLARREG